MVVNTQREEKIVLVARDGLNACMEAIQHASRIALDTEFHAERRNRPELMLIQIATSPEQVWLIDPQVIDPIPVAQATTSADQLIETGEVQYPLLGVSGTDVTREIAERFELDGGGALIEEVTPGSGADDAGLQPDDIIVAVDGREITSMSDLVVAIRRFQPGDTVEITYLRDGQQRTVEVTLVDRDDFVS